MAFTWLRKWLAWNMNVRRLGLLPATEANRSYFSAKAILTSIFFKSSFDIDFIFQTKHCQNWRVTDSIGLRPNSLSIFVDKNSDDQRISAAKCFRKIAIIKFVVSHLFSSGCDFVPLGFYDALSSRARIVAASTAFIRVPRSPPRSSACRPAIVVPPGLVTASLSSPGCCFVLSTI